MASLTEKEISYGMGGKFKLNQNYKKTNPKLIDTILILLYERRVEKSYTKTLFCIL